MSDSSSTDNSNSIGRLMRGFSWGQLGPMLALVVIIVLFAIAEGALGQGVFVSARNARVILSSTALVAVPALGMTIIIIAAGIDLSAGTALTLCGTVLASCFKFSEVTSGESGFAFYVTMYLGLTVLVGCFCGAVNGGLIAATRVVPFIVTLGTMTIFLGVGQIVADESSVKADPDSYPEWIRFLCYTGKNADNYLMPYLSIPTSALICVALAILLALVLKYTVLGRNIFAIGSNESTARLCGINVPLTLIAVYTISGFFVAVGGLLYFSDVKIGNPSDGMGKELEIIAAVVLGGGSLSGGRGSVLGTLVGALIITVIRNGCTLLSIPNTYTLIIIGCIIIAAVIVDQLRHGSPEWFFRMIRKGPQ